MRRLVWHTSFRRALKRRTHHNPRLRQRVLDVLAALVQNPFEPRLRTHKLRGRLEGLWACLVEYDCRIVFAFEPDPSGDDLLIVLVDIGAHDEVY